LLLPSTLNVLSPQSSRVLSGTRASWLFFIATETTKEMTQQWRVFFDLCYNLPVLILVFIVYQYLCLCLYHGKHRTAYKISVEQPDRNGQLGKHLCDDGNIDVKISEVGGGGY
jgi:hypothetical protein